MSSGTLPSASLGCLALACLACLACRSSAPDFTTGPNSSYGPAPSEGSLGSTSSSSSSGNSSGNSSSSSSTNSTSSGNQSTSEVSTTTFAKDVGSDKDLGDELPIGCQGKIDFLFVISSDPNLEVVQEQIVTALPEFIETIASKFDDFDYHILVASDDDGWGFDSCTLPCPDLTCLKGEPCCPDVLPKGELCCDIPNYPCNYLDFVTECDGMVGAGVVLPTGIGASNTLCKLSGGHRYITKGQSNLAETFNCIANVGLSGGNFIGDALVSAVSIGYNGPLGCNTGFLRDDALLMVTLVTPGYDSSYMFEDHTIWYERLLKAKKGDPNSIVMFLIGQAPGPCSFEDKLCQLAQMLPFNLAEDNEAKDYGPAFEEATGLLETACEQLIPQ